MEDVLLKLNPGLLWQKLYLTRRGLFLPAKWTYELWKKLANCYIFCIAFYGAETWTLRAVDQKRLEIFEMWCWRRMERTSWTGAV
jgi:hypothetical protein